MMTLTHKNAVAKAVRLTATSGKLCTVENINHYLSDGQKLDDAGLDEFHRLMAAPLPKSETAPSDEPTPAPEFVETAPEETAPEFVETAPEFVETAPEETAPAALTVAEAQRRLNASQNNYRAANDTVREKRAALGVALHRWLRLTDQAPPTAEENAREFIRQSNIERGLRATGQIPQRRHGSHGPSVIDQIASGTRGATYSNRSGAFAFKRGATTLAQSQAKLNAIQAEREMAAADPGGYPANALRRG